MGRKRRMRQEDIDWMLANYESKTIDECARELGVSVRTIPRWAEAIGLDKKRALKAISKVKINNNVLRRKDCVVKKCCLVCGNYSSCIKDKDINPCKMVCWGFELNEELIVE